jgi:hypothetical protein
MKGKTSVLRFHLIHELGILLQLQRSYGADIHTGFAAVTRFFL